MNYYQLLSVVLLLILTGQAESHNMSIIVLDSGSDSFRAGFAGDDGPRDIFTPVVGRPKKKFQNKWKKDVYVGATAENLSQYLDLSYPIDNGTIKNWEDLKVLWNFTFVERIRVSPKEHHILLTEPPMNTRKNRQKIANIMFNIFNVPAMYIANQAFLALYSTNRTTGIVLYSGNDVTYSVPIFEGQVMSHAVLRMEVGGRDLTNFLIKIMNSTLITMRDKKIADDIKDKLCYVAFDFEQEMTSFSSSSLVKSYELPDGKVISLGNERFRCPEALFKPTLLGKNVPGIHEVLYTSIMKCNTEQHRKLFSNIVLAGRAISVPGIGKRLTKEITWIAPSTIHVKVIAPPLRSYLTWIGGSEFASEPSFTGKMIRMEDYRKFGSSIIN